MILPWPSTGPTGGASRNPRNWPRPGRPPCGTSAGCARYAGNCCCSPTARQTPPGQRETWYAATGKAMARQAITDTSTGRTKHRLVHAYCARRHPDGEPSGTEQQTAPA